MAGENGPISRSARCATRLASVLIASLAPLRAPAAVPPPGGYTIQQLGLTGPGYEYVDSNDVTRSIADATRVTSAGQVLGNSLRYSASGADLGRDVWLFDGASIRAIGLFGDEYDTLPQNPAENYRYSYATEMNAAGQVAGYTQRKSQMGSDIWLFDGSTTHLIGLFGNGYEYGPQGAVTRGGRLWGLNSAGQVIGNSDRSSQSGQSLGRDAWIYSGQSTLRLGLTGSGFEYTSPSGTYRFSEPGHLSDSGHVVGRSQRLNSAGQYIGYDIWVYDGTNTRTVGLTGSEYEYPSLATGGGTFRANQSYGINSSGQVIGSIEKYEMQPSASANVVDQHAWFFDGETTRRVGLGIEEPQGPDSQVVYKFESPWYVNDARHVLGRSYRRNNNNLSFGEDAWYYDGISTRVIGLTGGEYEYDNGDGAVRNSYVRLYTASGLVVGQTQRRNDAGGELGYDAWFFDGVATRRIGLSGDAYEQPYEGEGDGVTRESGAYAVNQSGQVVGTSGRFDLDVPAYTTWFFDPITDETIDLADSLDGPPPAVMYPTLLTEEGVVIGNYNYYVEGEYFPEHLRAFWWSREAGFHDLTSLIAADLPPQVFGAYSSSDAAGVVTGGAPKFLLGLQPASGMLFLSQRFAPLLTASVPTGDSDLDGDVDLSDLGNLATHYGQTSDSLWAHGDFDLDGDVDLSDLGALATHYSTGSAQAYADFVALVPEPATPGLLAVAATTALRRRRSES